MPWDDLIRAANKAKARARIQGSTHLDQRYPKGKRPLKMSLNSWDDQAEKPKATTPPAKADPPKSDQSEASDKVRKDRKKKWQKEKRERKEASLEGNPQATGSNAVASGKKKSGQNRGQNRGQQDLSQITCWNCDKKGHYSTDCTEPPKAKK